MIPIDPSVATISQDAASDTALLHLAQQGDHAAFETLQNRLMPSITHFVRRLVGPGETDDIVQDVLIAFYTHLHQIDPPEKLRPFLYRVARNRAYDELRRRGRWDAVPIDDEPVLEWVSATTADHGSSAPEDLAHWLLLHIQVQEAMDRLPEAQRQALILYAEEGLAMGEIAEAMDTSVGTVKSRIFYARRTLRRILPAETLAALDAGLADS